MASPIPPPPYLYKILPPSHTPSSPLPEALPLLELDAQDGFMHLSTSRQLMQTLNTFFHTTTFVFVLRVPYERVAKFVKWEDAEGNSPPESGESWDSLTNPRYFPHVYENDINGVGEKGLKLGRDEVDQVKKWTKDGIDWSLSNWPFSEDTPSPP